MTLDDDRVKAVGEATGPRRLAGVASGGPGNSTDIATVMANAFVTAVVSALIVGLILARHAEHAKKDRIRSRKEVPAPPRWRSSISRCHRRTCAGRSAPCCR